MSEFRTDRVYLRDASWFNHPSTNGLPVFHFARADGTARCSNRIPLFESSECKPNEAAPRCSKAACSNEYEKHLPTRIPEATTDE